MLKTVFFLVSLYVLVSSKCNDERLHYQPDTGHCCIPVLVPKEFEDVSCTNDGEKDTIRPCPLGTTQPNSNISSSLRRRCKKKTCPSAYTTPVMTMVSGVPHLKCMCNMDEGFCGTEETHSKSSNMVHCERIIDVKQRCPTGIVQQDCSCRHTTTTNRPITTSPTVTTTNGTLTTKPTTVSSSSGINNSSIVEDNSNSPGKGKDTRSVESDHQRDKDKSQSVKVQEILSSVWVISGVMIALCCIASLIGKKNVYCCTSSIRCSFVQRIRSKSRPITQDGGSNRPLDPEAGQLRNPESQRQLTRDCPPEEVPMMEYLKSLGEEESNNAAEEPRMEDLKYPVTCSGADPS